MEETTMQEITMEDNVEAVTLSKEQRAQAIIRRNMYWSMGIGLVPIPILDLAGLTTVQIKLIKELSVLYDIPFKKDVGKSIVTSLVGTLSGTTLAIIVGSTLIKAVPMLGSVIGATSFSIAAGAMTYAVGKVFTSHYEAGGTLLNFNPQAMKEYFRQQYEIGREQVKEEKETETKSKTTKTA